jgi:hydroxymethylglutaryl-CoA reductase
VNKVIGFSKLSKLEKINYLVEEVLDGRASVNKIIKSFWHEDENEQLIFDDFSENTLTNFYFPYGVAPNVLLNDELLCVPMVIEESSVVAAAAKSAKFWMDRGGFKSEVISLKKVGQVHFIWEGAFSKLETLFNETKDELIESVKPLTFNMEKRGGGILDIKLIDRTNDEPGYYQIWAEFDTCDAMGANFINSVLEALAKKLSDLVSSQFVGKDSEIQIIMAILSNYTPDCRVKAWVECHVDDLEDPSHGMSGREFADKFSRAVRISKIDVNRATTHNKGIFNGIDSVVLATGNDFRAVEACGHTWACRDGSYRGLTDVSIVNDIFRFKLEIPLSLGTVGGLTSLHPLAKVSLDMLGRPSASKLMEISATIGLAQNFSALRSLTTTGIQKGHMKMHLMNILNQLEATDIEIEKVREKFEDEIISFQGIREYLSGLRNYQ